MNKRIIVAIVLMVTMVCYVPKMVNAEDFSSDNSNQRIAISDVMVCEERITGNARATSAPTSYAPSSWYNTQHSWTATYYTYSSYFFDTSAYPNLDIAANSSFTVEFYKTNGTYIGSVTPSYNSSKGKYYGSYYFNTWDPDYYMIIRNNGSSPISSGAWYEVSEALD